MVVCMKYLKHFLPSNDIHFVSFCEKYLFSYTVYTRVDDTFSNNLKFSCTQYVNIILQKVRETVQKENKDYDVLIK